MTREQIRPLMFWGWCLLVMASYVALHIAAGLTLPHPWTDESAFLWQAIAFQRHGWLMSPELNPTRDIMQMPPGYMVLMGILFRLVGVSLTFARTVSLVAMLGAFTLLACAIRNLRASFVPLLALGGMFLMVPIVSVGNVARMDSLVLLMGAACLFFLRSGRPFAALMAVSLAPLFHPNGFFFWAAAVVTVMVHWGEDLWPRKWIIVTAMGSVFAAWAWYGVYVAGHWSGFVADMTFQFTRKGSRDLPLLDASNLIVEGIVLGCAWYGFKRFRIPPDIALFGIALWMLYALGQEMWYECFRGAALVLMIAAILPVVVDAARAATPKPWHKHITLIVAVLIVVGGALAAYRSLNFSKTAARLWTGPWRWMRVADAGVPYITDEDQQRVRAYLRELNERPYPVQIQFHPPGDAMLFVDCETDRVQFYQATFISMEPDIYIVHNSRYLAPWFKEEAQSLQSSQHTAQERILSVRDSTEVIVAGPLGRTHFDNLAR